MTPSARALFSALFFLSGAAGLLYEVCWTRLLRLPMGNTVYSLTVVLTAFMGGLALGAWIAGRWIDRRGNPLRIYALLELGIGVCCLALPWIVQAEQPLFRWAYRSFGDTFLAFQLFKFFAVAFVILVPATFMGATLPVLCRAFFDDTRRVGRSIGWLYAINAFGAVCGSLFAGFVLIPRIGQRATILVGVATSISVAALAWWAWRRGTGAGAFQVATSASSAKPTPASKGPKPRPARAATDELPTVEGSLRTMLLVGYGLSGLAAMVLQIAWARVLSLAFGSSVYAFALLVAAFILGLALGSAAASRIADRLRQPVRAFAIAELGIGFAALAMVPIFQRYPEWMLQIVPALAGDFSRFQLAQFALVFVTLLLPTMCMGACLPLIGRALVRNLDHAAETVGVAYSANALGTIVGAFIGGFVFLPVLGMHRTILVGAAVNILVGAVLLLRVLPQPRGLIVGGAAAVLAGVLIAILPSFDPAVFTSGSYLYANRLSKSIGKSGLRRYMENENRILLHREGLAATITVKDTQGGVRTLSINGKADASDDRDMATQLLAGHLPSLLHAGPQDAAIIGLASGVTVHSVAQYPSVRAIDCIEIAPEMTEACRLFDHVNGGILDDPRVRLILQDGRNHLALTDKQYDVIVSEPSNPWIAGIANLFTREFLESCRDRLRPGGVMCLWIHLYGLDAHAIRSVARTFQEVFPDATLWETIFASDYQLVGSKGALPIDYEALRARMAIPTVAADLARIGVRSPADLLVRNLAAGESLQPLTGPGEIYRDDRNRLEFDAPRLMHQPTTLATIQVLQNLRRPGLPEWITAPAGGLPPADRDALAAVQEGQQLFWRGITAKMNGNPDEATRAFVAALEKDADLRDVWPALLETSRATIQRTVAARDTVAAESFYRHVLAMQPDMPDFYNDFGVLLANEKRLPEAEAVYRAAVEVKPRAVHTRLNLATALALQGKTQAAAAELDHVLAERPDNLRAAVLRGDLAFRSGDLNAAEQAYRAALAANPDAGAVWAILGEVLRQKGDCAGAVRALETAVRHDPAQPLAYRALADCYQRLGDPAKAARAIAQAGVGR